MLPLMELRTLKWNNGKCIALYYGEIIASYILYLYDEMEEVAIVLSEITNLLGDI
jgi:hypothetical protein